MGCITNFFWLDLVLFSSLSLFISIFFFFRWLRIWRSRFSPLKLGHCFSSMANAGKTQKHHLFLSAYSFLQQNSWRMEESPIKGIPVQRKNSMITITVGSSFCCFDSIIIFLSLIFACFPEAPEPEIVFPLSRCAY